MRIIAPKTHEEAVIALQRVLDHPKTREAMKYELRMFVTFNGGVSRHPISEEMTTDFLNSWMKKIIGQLWIHMFHVGQMRDTEESLVIFLESEIKGAVPRFGLWSREKEILKPIKVAEISPNFEEVLHVWSIISQKIEGSYRAPEITQYI